MTASECPICGQGTLKKEVASATFKYSSESVTIPGYAVERCSVCREALVSRDTLKTSGRILKTFKQAAAERRV